MSKTLQTLTFLVPTEHSEEAAAILRDISGTEPVIQSKLGMKIERVTLYLNPRKKTEKIETTFKKHYQFPFKIQKKTIEEADWRDKWKENYHPFKLTKKITVYPSWNENLKKAKPRDLILDPGFAFGTGLHETTQFMSRMIQKKRRRCQSLIDIGTGSGILALLAAKFDLKKIVAYDYDEVAVKVAIENAKKNHLEDLIHFETKDLYQFEPTETFDFITANISSEILLDCKTQLYSLMHSKSYLAISGIIKPNFKEVHKAYKKMGLRCLRKYIGKEWCGMLYKKKTRSTKRS